ncbi:MAG: hypothetical protein QXU82_00025 [Candidatus Aenigmatarchaeota archaeon]
MIDWFVSKIGMLLFVAVAMGLLIGFASMQAGFFEQEKDARAAEDVARLIDAAADGGSVTYRPDIGNYTLVVNSNRHSVAVNGHERFFYANASDATITGKDAIKIEGRGGNVTVS